MMEEERLLKFLKTNTAYGIELAIDQYGASVKTICQSILSGYSTQDIEEAVSDTFVGLWKSRDKIIVQNGAGIKGYLYGIARKSALNKKRTLARKGITKQLEEIGDITSEENVEETAVSNAEYQTLYELIDDMKSPDREIFIYRYYDQWTIREIAQRINLTEKAVENRLVRGRKYLRKQLAYQGMETT